MFGVKERWTSKVQVCSAEGGQAGSSILRALKAGDFRERSQWNIHQLSRCVCNMLMHKNEHVGEFGIILWSTLLFLPLSWFSLSGF